MSATSCRTKLNSSQVAYSICPILKDVCNNFSVLSIKSFFPNPMGIVPRIFMINEPYIANITEKTNLRNFHISNCTVILVLRRSLISITNFIGARFRSEMLVKISKILLHLARECKRNCTRLSKSSIHT